MNTKTTTKIQEIDAQIAKTADPIATDNLYKMRDKLVKQDANTRDVHNETREDLTDGYWNENTLVSVSDFRDINGEVRTNYFEKCDLANPEATYFCAVNGECFGLIHRGCGSCIAEVETALSYACQGYRYVTFALKSRTPSAIRNWQSKWSKRTVPEAHVSMFDASIRGTSPVSQSAT